MDGAEMAIILKPALGTKTKGVKVAQVQHHLHTVTEDLWTT